jgi:hypothetical protein
MHLEQSEIAIPAFYATHIAAIKPRHQGQLFLRDAALKAETADCFAEGKEQWVSMMGFGERRQSWNSLR